MTIPKPATLVLALVLFGSLSEGAQAGVICCPIVDSDIASSSPALPNPIIRPHQPKTTTEIQRMNPFDDGSPVQRPLPIHQLGLEHAGD